MIRSAAWVTTLLQTFFAISYGLLAPIVGTMQGGALISTVVGHFVARAYVPLIRSAADLAMGAMMLTAKMPAKWIIVVFGCFIALLMWLAKHRPRSVQSCCHTIFALAIGRSGRVRSPRRRVKLTP
nr:hypothetical protein [Paraburkholderia sp. HP33-1]